MCDKPKIVQIGDNAHSRPSDHVPKYLVLDALSHDVDRGLFKGPFKIADFGMAFHWSQQEPKMSDAGPYMTPELIAYEAIGGAADVWMFGCAIYQCLSGFDLMGRVNDPAVTMIHQIMEVLGQPPQEMLERWKVLFGHSAVTLVAEPRYPLSERVKDIRRGNESLGMEPRLGEFTEDDIAILIELLVYILKLDPKCRPTIGQVLEHHAMDYFRD